jgi:TetR/AcrR family transcriptional repressor of nem operon
MTSTPLMRERILIAAEKRVRAVGFNAVSFRDLANDVGVKSSSVHYHFPQKEDLGESLVQRYSGKFMAMLDQIDVEAVGPYKAMEAYISLYADALVVGESVCLCAILGSESNSLPERVSGAIQGFFQANIDWLKTVHDNLTISDDMMTPIEIVSALEGTMIVATSMNCRDAFDATSQRILRQYKVPQKGKAKGERATKAPKALPQMALFEDAFDSAS